MFASISLATPNSTVTSSFTAVEVCTVGVGEGFTVRVNGQVVLPRFIDLAVNDQIEIDVTAPAAGGYRFVAWTYNAVPSYFAVVSKQASNNPSLISIYRGKMWYDLPVSMRHLMSKKVGSTETLLSDTNNDGSPQTADLATLLDPTGPYLYFYLPDNAAMIHRIQFTAKPLGMTRMFNGTSRTWETYVLTNDGFISKIDYNWTVTKSTTAITDAKSIFSDGVTLFIGGINYVKTLSDQNTVSATNAVTDTVVYGAALTNTVMFAGSSGKIYKMIGGTVTMVYQSTMVGAPTVFQNQIVFPLPEEYKLKVYANDSTFIRDIDTGAKLPWAVTANRNTSMVVAYADSLSVDVFTTLVGTLTPSQVTFSYKVTFAQQVGTTMYASHYLREYTLTMPPNPPITGVTFPVWKAPIGVDVGSGEFVTVTQASALQAAVSPNATLMINGVTNATTVGNDQRVAVMLRSQQGHQKAAVVLGNYAFDFKVDALPSTSFATQISIDNKYLASQVIFAITVPSEVVNAPIALSHGTMKLNGSTYNGSTPVKAGDTLSITINVPDGAPAYWSMLSIADSQYALTIATAATKIADTQRYQSYLSTATKSTIVVDDDGTYYLPNYSSAQVRKAGNLLTFPAVLAKNDEVEITHTPMSSWWFDERDTVLIGPNRVYVVQGITAVDDIPNNVDFGTVHMGIPDFDFYTDATATIQGISDKYSIVIFSEHMMFSVNGAAPVASPTVKNGDVVQVIYNVMNMWEDRYVKTTLYDGRDYEFGVVHIDPPLGINFDPAHESFFLPTFWAEYDQAHEIGGDLIVAAWNQTNFQNTPAGVGVYDRPGVGLLTNSAVSFREPPANQLPTPSAVSQWETSPTQTTTPGASKAFWQSAPTYGRTAAPKGLLQHYAPDLGFDTWKPRIYERTLYNTVDVAQNYVPSYGHEVIFRTFDAYWEPFQDIAGKSISVEWIKAEALNNIQFSKQWVMEARTAHYPVDNISQFQSAQPFKMFSPLWIYDTPDRRWVNENSGVYAYIAWQAEQFVKLNPVFAPSQVGKFYQNVPYNNPSAKPLYGKNDPLYARDGQASSPASVGQVAGDRHWTNVEPLKTGGFSTQAAAFAAGSTGAGQLTVLAYQQPEGAFSYIVKRETNLTCPIQTSDITAGKWLLGGG